MKNKITLLLLGTLALIQSACHKAAEEPKKEDTTKSQFVSLTEEQLKSIKTDTVRLVNEQSDLALTGKVSFNEDKVAKVFPLVGGNVLKVNVTLGDYVHKGEVLAVLRSGDIGDIQNQYNIAQSNVQIAKKNLDIAEELFKTSVNSEKDVLNARNDYKKAQGDVSKLEQVLKVYGAKGGNLDAEYNVVAPTDGYIVEKNINENMEIRSDNASNIFTVSFLETVWVMADVYESDISKIKLGEEVDITTIAYPDRVFRGTIKQIGNVLDPNARTLKARVVLDNREGLLKPEMFATVKVHINNPNKIPAIPTKALVFDNNAFHVLVVKGRNSFEKRTIIISQNSRDMSYIKAGLTPGEVIVSQGCLLVYNNELKK